MKLPKKPEKIPTLNLKVIPPYDSSYEEAGDFGSEEKCLSKIEDLGDWLIRVMAKMPG